MNKSRISTKRNTILEEPNKNFWPEKYNKLTENFNREFNSRLEQAEERFNKPKDGSL